MLSIVIWFKDIKETDAGKVCWNNNCVAIAQRVSGILMLVMTVLHVQNGSQVWVYQVLYIAVTSAHVALSFPRAMITLGVVKSEAAYKKFQIASVVVSVALTVWCAVFHGSTSKIALGENPN